MKKLLLLVTIFTTSLLSAQQWVDFDNSVNLFGDPEIQQVITTEGNQKYCVYGYNGGNGVEGRILKFNEGSKSWEEPNVGFFAYSMSNLSITTIANDLYIGYINEYSPSEYRILKFDGTDTTNIGLFNTGTWARTVQLASNSSELYFYRSENSDARVIEIQKYDGTPFNWTEELYYDGFGGGIVIDNILESFGQYNKDVFHVTENDLWILGGDGNDPAPDSLKLFRSVIGSDVLTLHARLESDATNYTITGVDNDFPVIGYVHNFSSDDYFSYHQVTASGTNELADDIINNFSQITLAASSNSSYLTGVESGTEIKAFVKEWNGSGWVDHVNGDLYSSSDPGSIQLTAPSLFANENGRLFASTTVEFSGFKSGSTGLQILISNAAPASGSFSSNNHCIDAWNAILSDDFVVTDSDMDSTYLFVDGQPDDVSIIDSINIVFSEVAYNPLSISRTFTIKGNYFGNSGDVTIPIGITDGYDTTYVTMDITVHELPNITYNLPGALELCTNGDLYNLNSVFLPQGGNYSGEGVTDHYFDPLEIPRNTVFSMVNYEFVDANGCYSSSEAQVDLLQYDTVLISSNNSSCSSADGDATVSVSGSNGPHSIYWSNGITGSSVSNLSPGVYYANVTHGNGCIAVEQVNIQSTEIGLTQNITNPTCYGYDDGAIDITVTGAAPFQFLWATGDSTEDISNLVAGNYFVTITDDNGCISTGNFNVSQPGELTFETSIYDASCANPVFGGDLGINNPQGGSGTYDYWWSNPSWIGSSYNMYAEAGTYQFVLQDDQGCFSDTSYLTVNNSDGPILSATNSPSSCSLTDGSIDLSISLQANPIANILWSNGATTEDLTGLEPGDYSVTVTDDQGCETYLSQTVLPVKPLQNDLCVVTVDTTTTTNLIVWEPTETSGIDHYNIYREGPVAGDYLKIGEKNGANLSQFTDLAASPEVRSWRYKISATNECGVEGPQSLHHKTIHVVFIENGGQYEIHWDDYEGFNYPTFYLERRDASNMTWVPVADGPSSSFFSYTDTPPVITGLDYRVSVETPGVCQAEKANDYNSSRSNRSAGTFAPEDVDLAIVSNGALTYDVSLYPNPSSNELNILVDGSNLSNIIIRTVNGQIIRNEKLNGVSYNTNITDFAAGIYFVEVSTENGKTIHKLIKK